MNDNKALERTKIIAALRTECADCSERHWCNNGTNGVGVYCPVQDAAQLLERYAEPPNDPLTLEELRGMDGESVWVEQLNGDLPWGTYSIVWLSMRSATNGYVRFPFEKYSKTWLAYRRKPDGGGE